MISVRHALQVIGVIRTVGVANCYRKTLCKNRNNEGSYSNISSYNEYLILRLKI